MVTIPAAPQHGCGQAVMPAREGTADSAGSAHVGRFRGSDNLPLAIRVREAVSGQNRQDLPPAGLGQRNDLRIQIAERGIGARRLVELLELRQGVEG